MKKLIALTLILVLPLGALMAAEKSFNIPKAAPKITIRGDNVLYEISNLGATNERGTHWTTVRFSATLAGELIDADVIVDDMTRFSWSQEDGIHAEAGIPYGNAKGLVRLQKKFKEIALPPIKVDTSSNTADMSESQALTHTFRTGQVLTFKKEGTIPVYAMRNPGDRYILRNSHNELIEVGIEKFLFPLPDAVTFRLGEKAGKYVALVEKDGKWVIPATDYYPPLVSTSSR